MSEDTLKDYGYVPGALEEKILKVILLQEPLDQQTLHHLERVYADLNHGMIMILLSLRDHPQFKQLSLGIRENLEQHYLRTKKIALLLKLKLRTVGQVLISEGIDMLVLKGMALASLYYPNPTHRPMYDIDLVVKKKHLDRTITILRDQGFVFHGSNLDCQPTSQHAITAFSADGLALDLHTGVLYSSLWSDADRLFWENRQTLIAIADRSIDTLNPSDHLLHTVLHGFRHSPCTPVRWILDAGYLLKQGDIDWAYLVSQAKAHDCTSVLYVALNYLKLEMTQNIPADVLDALHKTPGCRRSIRFFKNIGYLSRRADTVYQRFLNNWYAWQRLNWGEERSGQDKTDFLAYMLDKWKVDRIWHIPKEMVRRWHKKDDFICW
ncbi:nucleotidyltransferase domain-containing protein [Magnetococcales bacterium HHB-1]